MKIIDIKITPTIVLKFDKPIADAFIWIKNFRTAALQVFTDENIVGVSTIGPYGHDAIKALIESELKHVVIGEDPMCYERIWDKMYWYTLNHGRKGIAIEAIGCIDVAIWDIIGKALNQPVYKLLGGYSDSVKAYRTGIDLNLSLKELIELHKESVNQGFDAVKMKIGRRNMDEDLERVKAVRDAIGYKVKLMVDANNSLSINTAIRLAKKLEKYEVFWFEEPVLADNIDGLAEVARSTEIPLALGENEYLKFGIKELIEKKALGVLIGTVQRLGGVTEWRKIVAITQAWGIPVSPQGGDWVAAHALASIPNGLFMETAAINLEDGIIKPKMVVKNSYVKIPNLPGFGWEIDHDKIDKLRGIEWIRHETTPPTLPRPEYHLK
ncbi:MAG: mandelate racemase/muconate lactonizing enzyme family protein [Nitrososphaerota archaeon]